jgi:DNA-binding transcriptional regulator YiaG
MNITQRSKKLGIAKSTLHRWIKGYSKPSPMAERMLKEQDPVLYSYLQEKVWRDKDAD